MCIRDSIKKEEEPVVESKPREGVINCEKCSTPLQLEPEEIECGEYYCPFCMQVSKIQ